MKIKQLKTLTLKAEAAREAAEKSLKSADTLAARLKQSARDAKEAYKSARRAYKQTRRNLRRAQREKKNAGKALKNAAAALRKLQKKQGGLASKAQPPSDKKPAA